MMTVEFMRKRNRLEGFDYSKDGVYFITICTKDKEFTLSRISGEKENAVSVLSNHGQLVRSGIELINVWYPFAKVLQYVIMPNHVHILLELRNARLSVSAIISYFKSYVTRNAGVPVWQKSFYDHIVRNHDDFCRISEYIAHNPENWALDSLAMRDSYRERYEMLRARTKNS